MTPEAFARMIGVFVGESRSQVEAFVEDLALLADDPADATVLERAHRSVHTLKGASSMLAMRAVDERVRRQLDTISHLARLAEERIEAAMEGQVHLTAQIISILRRVSDHLTSLLGTELDVEHVEAWSMRVDKIERQLAATLKFDQSADTAMDAELSTLMDVHEDIADNGGEEQISDSSGSREEQLGKDETLLDEENAPSSDSALIDAYRGDTPPPSAAYDEPVSRDEPTVDLHEVNGMLEQDIAVPPQRLAERSERETAVVVGEPATDKGIGETVMRVLSYIIGEEIPDDDKQESDVPAATGELEQLESPVADEPATDVAAPSFSEHDAALEDLLGLEHEQQSEEEPSAVEGPVHPETEAKDSSHSSLTLQPPAEQSSDDVNSSDESSLADLLGIESDESQSAEVPVVELDELHQVFYDEAREIVSQLWASLDTLRRDPANKDALATFRRAAHTIKGSSAMLGYSSLQVVGLSLEQAADAVGTRSTLLTKETLGQFSEAVRWLSGAVDRIGRAEEPGDAPELIAKSVESAVALDRETQLSEEDDLTALELAEAPDEPGTSSSLSPASVPSVSSGQDDPMRTIFLEEVRGLLDDLNQDIVSLEQDAANTETLNRILRASHTLKGSAATVGYEQIRTLAHRMEDILQRARDEQFSITSEVTDVLLSAVDRIDELAKEIDRTGAETREIGDIVSQLEAVLGSASTPVASLAGMEAGLGQVSGIREKAETDEAESLRAVFVSEARELLDILGRDLVTLEQNPSDADTVHRAMRTAHTLKGSASMLGFERIRTVAHGLEDALHIVRDGNLAVSADAVDIMLAATDVLENQVQHVARAGAESDDIDIAVIVERLHTLVKKLSPDSDIAKTKEKPSQAFLDEMQAQQTSLVQTLAALEQDPENTEARHRFAVVVSSLAGSTAELGYEKVTSVLQHIERIMEIVQEKALPLDSRTLDALAQAMEVLSGLFAVLREGKSDDEPDVAATVERLRQLTMAGGAVQVEKPQPSEQSKVPMAETPVEQNRRGSRRIVEVDLDRLNQLMNLAAELVISRTRLAAELLRLSGIVNGLGEQSHQLSDVERKLISLRVPHGDAKQSQVEEGILEKFSEGEFDRFSDFDVIVRDLRDSSSFINDMGNEFSGMASNFDQNITRISSIAKDLHDEILRVRMVHVERAFTRIPRIIRDAARSENKQVDLILEGADTEIDKNILEAMNNPLLHLLRNTVSHGIESPEERMAKGKPAAGRVTVRAAQDGNQIVIEVSDDGSGIDVDRVRNVAVKRGLLNDSQAKMLSDTEITDLIFEPGFSTSDAVSELAGRGVGLDVVRSVVGRFNGTVAVESLAGQGTTFHITLPLTLAIGQALLVQVGSREFALPLASIHQIEEIGQDDVVMIKDQPYIYRDDVPVPVVLLGEALSLEKARRLSGERQPVVLAREGDRRTAIVVDRIVGREDIVIKTLGNHLRHVPGISGATILGDGSVVMILNVPYFLSAVTTAQRRTTATVAKPVTEVMSNRVEQGTPRRVLQGEKAAKGKAARSKVPNGTTPTLRDKHILVVDDSISIRKYVSGVLERGGYRVLVANDGVDAWEKLQQKQNVQLVISDLEMPRMHGYELIAEIKKDIRMRHLPVVFLTARAGEKHHRMGAELGAAAFLNKPFSEADLLNLVERLVA